MKKFLVIFVITTIIFSCNNANRKWSAADRAKFVRDCTNEASSGGVMTEDQAKKYCECMRPKIEAKYPTVAEANKLKASDMQTDEWMNEAKNCLGMGNINLNNNDGSNPVDNTSTDVTPTGDNADGWTSAERTRFVEDCYGEAKSGMGEDKARSYCECMQPKLEAKYRSFAAANRITQAELQSEEWLKEVRACLGY
jgi:hypothetical protein